MRNFLIRKATKEDVPQLCALMQTYIVDFYKQPQPKEDDLISLIHALLDHTEKGMQFVAEKDGQLIGFATLYFTFSTLKVKGAAILNDLFVVQHERGQKAGERLFQQCLSYIRENGFANMTWETAKDNLVAQKLYEKMGAKQSKWLAYEIH
ncbi:N-acetyltransferase [Weizmannia acidilactici]|uniref:N-acetyltransferase n=1 Tax=Weizmannia acidilactici TaxID=2607726 RepID=A0A5J4JHT0_9BACI|nr:GNAT family N-acetyltransferase [Weizmannia acidilactici]GER66534.1 N-acetyltransferase [Weizmannia acidilactici]GER70245.1 N-acetyltransferase [Weizmannia acidilactici]GER74554.1 N-acetyltransferase [Weizmannia acidilactici]